MKKPKHTFELNSISSTIIDLALTEDLGKPFFDITTQILFSNNLSHGTSKIISKNPSPITIAGLGVVQHILARFEHGCTIHSELEDGGVVEPGETILQISGPVQIILMAERTILNFLQRLCAIATLTKCYVNAVKDTQLKILDTRKTTPGLRQLEKYAVQCGGGVNHRMGLYDAIMIKDTHIDLVGGISNALERLPNKIIDQYPVIVEVRTIDELELVLQKGQHKVTRILLDNMQAELMSDCVKICDGAYPLEASGNIDLTNIQVIAQTGVNFASVGKLTHSAGSVDLSMKGL